VVNVPWDFSAILSELVYTNALHLHVFVLLSAHLEKFVFALRSSIISAFHLKRCHQNTDLFSHWFGHLSAKKFANGPVPMELSVAKQEIVKKSASKVQLKWARNTASQDLFA
jgi:hypothetical protein